MNDNSPQEEQTITESVNSAVENSFFYTNDRFINTLDTNDILKYIQKTYPLLTIQSSDQQIKSTILQLLSNESYMLKIFKLFNITLFDFFKCLNSNYGILFKGVFLKKVQKEINKHEYGKKYLRKTNN